MYKKYITKKGKRIGPYYYNSIRLKDGRIKTVYLGRNPPPQSKKTLQKRKETGISSPPPPLGGRSHLYVCGLIIFIAMGFIIFSASEQGKLNLGSLFSKARVNNFLTGLAVTGGTNQTVEGANQTAVPFLNSTNETALNLTVYTVTKPLALHAKQAVTYQLETQEDLKINIISIQGLMENRGEISVYWDNGSSVLYHAEKKTKDPLAKGKSLLTGFAVAESGQPPLGAVQQTGNETNSTTESLSPTGLAINIPDLFAPAPFMQFNISCSNCTLTPSKKTALLVIDIEATTLNITQMIFTVELPSTGLRASMEDIIAISPIDSLPGKKAHAKNLTYRALKKANFSNEKATLTIVEQPLQVKTDQGVVKRLTSSKAEKGPNWVRVCEGGSCTHDIYTRQVNILDSDGKYKLFTDVVKVSKMKGDAFKVSWFDNEVNITFEGAQLVRTEVRSKGSGYEWVHWYNYTSEEDVPLATIRANKVVQEDGMGIIVDGVRIGFEDAEEQGFEVLPVSVDQDAQAFMLKKNLGEENVSIGQIIELDPLITLAGGDISEDATIRETSSSGVPQGYTKVFNNLVAVRVGLVGCETTTQQKERSYFDYNVSSIPDDVVIEQVNFTFGVRGLDDDNQDINVTEMNGWASEGSNQAGFLDAVGPVYAGVITSGFESIRLNLGVNASARLQANLSSDKFSLGMRTNELGTLPTCPTQDTTRTLVNASEDEFPPALTVTYSLSPPEIVLNAPANNSVFLGVGNVVLNATVTDRNDATLKEVVFFGAASSPPTSSDVLAIFMNVANGTQVAYNWTSPVTEKDGNTLLLLHFDNRSIFGENTTVVNDFSDSNYDGVVDGARFNWTSAKMGGGYEFDGNSNYINFGDRDDLIGGEKTYMMWINPLSFDIRMIVDKLNPGAMTGFRIEQDSASITITGDSEALTAENFLDPDEFTHLAVTIESDGSAVIYKDGVAHTTGAIGNEFSNDIEFTLGRKESGGPAYFHGILDEFVVINGVLNEDSIMDAYRLATGTYYWNVNATDGTLHNTSLTRVFTMNAQDIPTITLNAPENASTFTGVGNIILNVSVTDPDATENLTVTIFGANGTSPTLENLIFRAANILSPATLTYNWTAPQILNQSGLLFLAHMDNNSAFGENRTRAYDFTGLAGYGTVGEDSFINATAGKLGGAYQSNGVWSGGALSFDGASEHTGGNKTYLAWLNTRDVGNPAGTSILAKAFTDPETESIQGFQIYQVEEDLYILGNGGSSVAVKNFFAGKKDTYVHMAMVLYENNTVDVYRDGVFFNATVVPPFSIITATLVIGGTSLSGFQTWNGTIDEMAIFGKSLSSNEVLDLYRLKGGAYHWFANVTDGVDVASSERRIFTINSPPVISVGPTLAPASANTTDQLNCTFTITDANAGDAVSTNITFYNGTLIGQSFNVSITLGSSKSQAATAGLQAKNENWRCQVVPFDGTSFGNGKNSTTIAIVNSVPSIPTLVAPANNNVTTNTIPFFNWTSADADNDPINYTLNITCLNVLGGSCPVGDDSRQIGNIIVSNYTPNDDFNFFMDDGFSYNWTVRATDGSNTSAFAKPFNVSFAVLVDIVLTTSTVDFGSLEVGSNDSTDDSVPVPLKLQNFGNSQIDVNLSANNFLFDVIVAPSNNFLFKITEPNPIPFPYFTQFNSTLSKTNYTQVTISNVTAIVDFNITAAAHIGINISVPMNEPPGVKRSTLTLLGLYRGWGQVSR